MPQDGPLHRLCDDGCESDLPEVIASTCCWFLACGDDGGRLDVGWDGGLYQGKVEDHGKDI